MDKNLNEMLEAVKLCHSHGMTIPAISLAYITIDTLGWIKYRSTEKSSKKRFILWSEEYMADFFDKNCTSLELYSSRCAILHSISSESSLSSSGLAREFLYASGRGSADLPNLVGERLKSKNTTCIYVGSLIESLESGTTTFLEQCNSNQADLENLKPAQNKQYVTVPAELFRKIIPMI